MSILSTAYRGKQFFWKNVLNERKYQKILTEGTVYEGRTLYWSCFKYPNSTDRNDSAIITEKNELIAYISYEDQGKHPGKMVTVLDLHHLDMCEEYWNTRHDTDTVDGCLSTKNMAKHIIDYEHIKKY